MKHSDIGLTHTPCAELEVVCSGALGLRESARQLRHPAGGGQERAAANQAPAGRQMGGGDRGGMCASEQVNERPQGQVRGLDPRDRV